MPSKKTLAVFICSAFGCVFIGVGVALIFVFHNMIHNHIKEAVHLTEGSDTFKDWVTPPVPVYFQVWTFDVVNSDEVVSLGSRPSLVQRGPYTYKEHREKVNITFNKNNTVTYREEKYYVFQEHMSVGPENDTFTTANIPMIVDLTLPMDYKYNHASRIQLVVVKTYFSPTTIAKRINQTMANMIRYEYGVLRKLANLLLEGVGEKLFLRVSVADILWGYEDKLLEAFDDLLRKFTNKTIDDHFGLFYKQNGSDDGVYNINTGVDDPEKFAIIRSWNYNSSLPYWATQWADKVNGTDGTMYPPFVDASNPLYLFSTDVCRSLFLMSKDAYTYKEINLKRFVAPDSLFWNVTANPDNAGFCSPAGNCLPGGLLNVSNCKQNAPIVMSQPHFLAADKTVTDRVDGLHPNRKEHQTELGIELMTGLVMNAAKKLQINVFMEPIEDITVTDKIKPVFLPILWINESAVIDDKNAAKFRAQVEQPIKITQAVQYGLITLGIFILVCVIVLALHTCVSKPTYIHLQNINSDGDEVVH